MHTAEHLPVQTTLPAQRISRRPLIAHKHNEGAVAGLARRHSRHTIGQRGKGTEVGQAAAHATHVVGHGLAVVAQVTFKGSVIHGAVDGIAVDIVEAIGAAPAGAGVAFCRQVEILQCPGQAGHRTKGVIPLAATDHTALPHRKGIEHRVQPVILPGVDVEVGALHGILLVPAGFRIFERRGSGNIAHHAILQHIRVLLVNFLEDGKRHTGAHAFATESEIMHPFGVAAYHCHQLAAGLVNRTFAEQVVAAGLFLQLCQLSLLLSDIPCQSSTGLAIGRHLGLVGLQFLAQFLNPGCAVGAGFFHLSLRAKLGIGHHPLCQQQLILRFAEEFGKLGR